METVGCTDIDVMTVPGMEDNLYSTSDQPDAANVIPRPGVQTPDFWSPPPSDDVPVLKVVLPEVNGVRPEDYDVMTIKINAQNFDGVTVTVVDSNNKYIFSVSISSFVHILQIDQLCVNRKCGC